MTVSLASQLFTPEQIPHIRKLWNDRDARLLIVQQMGKELENSDKLVVDNSLNQVICILSQSQFADDEEEVAQVGTMVFYCLRIPDVLPSLRDHRGKEFSARTLISLAWLEKAMEFMCQHHGAPKPQYYQDVAVVYLRKEKMDGIAAHFNQWKNFLNEHLAN